MLISVPYLGKSVFLFYLLLHRLERCLPTAVQLDADFYFVFDAEGAACHRLHDRSKKLEQCWALADSSDLVQQPCKLFMNRAKCVIQMSSPKAVRWKEWIKQKLGLCFYMDLPTVPEIAAVV